MIFASRKFVWLLFFAISNGFVAVSSISSLADNLPPVMSMSEQAVQKRFSILFTHHHDKGSHFASMRPLMARLLEEGHRVTALYTLDSDEPPRILASSSALNETGSAVGFVQARLAGTLDWKGPMARRFWNGTTHACSGLANSVMKRIQPAQKSNAHYGLADTYANGDHHMQTLMRDYAPQVCFRYENEWILDGMKLGENHPHSDVRCFFELKCRT